MVREVSTCRGVHVRSVPEVRKLVMTDGVLLQPEQEELLKALVEASRNVPRDEREEFHLLTDGDGTSVMHPGLPGRQMRVHQGDVDILEADGLLLVTQIGRWHRSFVVTPLGFSLSDTAGRGDADAVPRLRRLPAVVPGGAPEVGRRR